MYYIYTRALFLLSYFGRLGELTFHIWKLSGSIDSNNFVNITLCYTGSAIDTLCVYQFICGPEFIDILTRRDSTPLIPIKNVYVKAIPGLKQNVLSARISKLGIRSLVLSEPYVSTLKKLNLGLTGSSHYITVTDFIKICGYFRRSIGSFIANLDLILSTHAPGDVVRMFNDPGSAASRALLSRLSEEAGQRNVGKEEALSEIGGGALWCRGCGHTVRSWG